MEFSLNDILSMDELHRKNLINSVGGFKSANLIGTTDGEGRHNLAIFNSVVHLGAHPPYMGFILRPPTVPRHTYENIKATGWFTVNHIHRDIAERAHQTAARYHRDESEFDATGLTPAFGKSHPAPYVAESKIQIGLEYAGEENIRINGTILVIGRITEIRVPDEALTADYFVNPATAGTVAIAGLDGYFTATPLRRLSHPRKGQPLTHLHM
jgi:flavin reductase (DIM6/NTAB) family NADH-FMN oxidoreductase RutF